MAKKETQPQTKIWVATAEAVEIRNPCHLIPGNLKLSCHIVEIGLMLHSRFFVPSTIHVNELLHQPLIGRKPGLS